MENVETKKYLIITYGCQMNVHDSEKISGMFEELGMTIAQNKADADYIVFNTCCIRESAEDKAYNNICALKPLKTKKPNLRIIVCGCMAQQKEGKYDLKNRLDFVDIIIGTHNINMLKSYVLTNFIENKKIFEILAKPISDAEHMHNTFDETMNAYVNIMYGCNNFCTYCIVPYVRGREKSRPPIDIINEARLLVEKGYKYITLLGQNVNSYGNDLSDEGVNFASLLTQLCHIEGDFKIKFLTSHPKDFTDSLIKVIAKNTKIARSIHLPVQSGNNKILENMNRRYTTKKYMHIIKKLRKAIPNVAISTDIIVGFPGETGDQFVDTLKLIKKAKFSTLFAFIYSKRTGTPAAKLPNQIDKNTKNKRINELLNLQKNILPINNKCFLNKSFRILVKSFKDGAYVAETDFGKPVEIVGEVDNDRLPYFTLAKLISVDDGKFLMSLKGTKCK